MKCAQCGKEVVLARICPYCGAAVEQEQETPGERQAKDSKPKGAFRGRIDTASRHSAAQFGRLLPDIVSYFRDPQVARWRKNLIIIGIIYVLSPFDLVPGAMLPFLGWLDDAVVAAMAWRMLIGEIEHYRRKQR